MGKTIFRKKSMEKISSPEQMNDYIRVSNPGVWMILAAVIVLLAGVCVWGMFGRLDTAVKASGVCTDGRLTVYISESDISKITDDAIISLGDNEYSLNEIAKTPVQINDDFNSYLLHLTGLSKGDWVYTLKADAPDIKDGTYSVSVITERVKPLDFVLN